MASITLRSTKGSPLTNTEVDNNFSNINAEVSTKLTASLYTAADVLTKIKTVDGAGSGLDSDFLDGLSASSANTVSTIVARDGTGGFSAGAIIATSFTGPLTGNVTGTVTDGVVTTGSYSNPTWLTINATKVGLGNVTNESKATMFTSPTFTGVPISTTAAAATNTTQIATCAFVGTAVTNGLATLGNMSAQNSSTVSITGGTINSITITSIGTNSTGTKTISTAAPTGGVNGDVWYRV